MSTRSEDDLENLKLNSISEDEIDLNQVYRSLIRNRRIIIILGLAGLFFGGIIAFNTKKSWMGEFQIVLQGSNNQIGINSLIDSNLANIVGLDNNSSNNTLKTEVEILKSSSVLMNVFEFVKNEKSLNDEKFEHLRFKSWRQNLDVELEKGTSVLNISYRDYNKDIILPVLNSISATYQDYSGRKRLKEIKLAIDYYEKQIEIYKNKSYESLIKAHQFAVDQDLAVLSLAVLRNQTEIDKEIQNIINIEAIRIEAANNIRYINEQLRLIENLKGSEDQIIYIASTIPSIVELSDSLKSVVMELAEIRLNYKEDDEKTQDLIKQKDFYMGLLKRQVRGFLLAAREDEKSKLKSSERPPGVLTKYKQLLNVTYKDNITVDKLEDNYRALLLEKARTTDPWELITSPVLLPQSVGASRSRILILGLLGGTLIGVGAALVNDKIKDIIYLTSEIDSLSPWPLLAEISVSNNHYWYDFFHVIVSRFPKSNEVEIALIPVGIIDETVLRKISDEFHQFTQDCRLITTKNIVEISKCTSSILVTNSGSTKRNEFIQIKNKLILNKTQVLGFILLRE